MSSPNYDVKDPNFPEVRKLHKYHDQHNPVEFYTPRPDGSIVVWSEFGEVLGVLIPVPNEAKPVKS